MFQYKYFFLMIANPVRSTDFIFFCLLETHLIMGVFLVLMSKIIELMLCFLAVEILPTSTAFASLLSYFCVIAD